MAFSVLNYYLSGNTAKGYQSLIESNIEGVKTISLFGNYKLLKTELLKLVVARWTKMEHSIEILHSATNKDYIEGVINRTINLCIIDGNSNHDIDTSIIKDTFDLDDVLDNNFKEQNTEKIVDSENEILNNHLSAYEYYSKALDIHDEWEEIYISNMNKKRATEYIDEVINLLLKETTFEKVGKERHRFFGAATADGPIDYVEQITESIGKRYFIKGRPGTGKSTLLKKLVVDGIKRGINVYVYHCGLDPNSLDMVILRDLDIVIFDSTAPHEYFPSKDNDEIIDVYKEFIKPGTDELYSDQLEEIIKRYTVEINIGTDFLAKSKDIMRKMDSLYETNINKAQMREFILKFNSKLEEYEK